MGHSTFRYKERGSIVTALASNGTRIYGISDYRKRGVVIGY